MERPNLNKIIEENLKKDKFQSKTQPSLPKGGWLDQYMNTGGTYISDRAQATQFGQYRMGGGMFPEYHSFAPPRMNNGGGLLSRTVTCSRCGHSWKAIEGGGDALTCHNCGGMARMQYGGDPSIADLDRYELAGTVRPKPILAPAATESTARSFHNPMLGAATSTATTGYRDNMAQTKKPITGTIPTMANNFGLANPRDIMGRNTSSSTQAPPLYNAQQNRDIRVNSATGQKQVQTLMKAGQNKAAATYAVANKKFTGNQQKILDDRAALEHNVTLHKNYDPNKSIEQQSGLADDQSIGTRLWRGSRSSPGGATGAAWEIMSAPGKAAVNFSNPEQYAKQGWGAIPSIALDALSIVPELGSAAASTIRGGVSRGVLGNAAGQAQTSLLHGAQANIAHAEAPAVKQIATHMGEHFDEGIKHMGAHKGFHAMSGDHGHEGHEGASPTMFAANIQSPFKGMKAFKTGGWLDNYL